MSQNSPSLLHLIRTTLSSRKHLRFYILQMFVDKDEIILRKRRKRRQGEEEEASVHSATGTKDHRLSNILTHTHTHTHKQKVFLTVLEAQMSKFKAPAWLCSG